MSMLPDNLGLSSSEQIFEGCKIEFLNKSSSKASTSRDHFFHFFSWMVVQYE